MAYSIAGSYELPRSGQHQPAAAQSLQTLKAIVFPVLNSGNMGVAQVLTGVPDPCSGSQGIAGADEIAFMANYMEAQSTMEKHVASAATKAPAGPTDAPLQGSGEEATKTGEGRRKKAAKEKRLAAEKAGAGAVEPG